MAKQEIIQLANGDEIRLTEREKMFCEYYLGDADRNATQAAIMAGYSKKTAKTIAAQNLSKLNLKKYIYEKTAPMLERLGVTQEKVLAEFAAIGFAKLSDFMNDDYTMKRLDEIDPSKISAMESVQVDEQVKAGENDGEQLISRRLKFKTHDKIRALEKLYAVLNPDQGNDGSGDVKKQFFTQVNNYYNK